MKGKILVNINRQETRIATLEQEIVQDIYIERNVAKGLTGNIYLGVVRRVLPGLQSAFIDIGTERAAFLHITNVIKSNDSPNDSLPRIESLIFEGQTIIVQVIKDPIGTKGARLSTQISIAGRYLVLLPKEPHIGVSQRIDSEELRATLRLRLDALLKNNPDSKDGYIIRTSAEYATDNELQADIDFLNRLWKNILYKAQRQLPRSLLFDDLPLYLRVVRDMAHANVDKIIVDNWEAYRNMQDFAQHFIEIASDKIIFYAESHPLFEFYQIENEIESALSRKVKLQYGGYLIFDQTEAMTTIDVNTGGFIGKHDFDETIFKTNLEAAQSIARQLRLRNLGGIIIIDFIDMENEAHKAAVLAALKLATDKDRTRITLNGFTSLGLVEVTRKRTRDSLAHTLCAPCPTCQGQGQLKSARTICYEILREIARNISRISPIRECRVLASQSVIELFLEEEANSLAELASQINTPIYLQSEISYPQELFDIVYMQL